jgi:hypothetical protein
VSRKLLWILVSQCWTVCLYSITCTEADYQPALCDLPVLEGTRCANAEFFRSYCNEKTDGCGAVGGCFGFTPPGHWYPILGVDGKPFRRCRCGCFAAETKFWGTPGMTGKSLLEAKENSIRLRVLTEFGSPYYGKKRINGLMHAKETRAIHLVTQGGHSLYLSDGHPVVVATAAGAVECMKQAKDIAVGDFLLTRSHQPVRVLKNETVFYEGEMMNFNVESQNPIHHIVIANDLQMGDLAWQEQLHAVEARMYHRQDLWVYLERNVP